MAVHRLPDAVPESLTDAVADFLPDAVTDFLTDAVADFLPDAVADFLPDAVTDSPLVVSAWLSPAERGDLRVSRRVARQPSGPAKEARDALGSDYSGPADATNSKFGQFLDLPILTPSIRLERTASPAGWF